jgi:hypothetical protein
MFLFQSLRSSAIKPKNVFFFGLIALFFLYLPCYKAKFFSDYLSWAKVYHDQGWSGIGNNFGDVSLKYTYHAVMYAGYAILGWSAMGWFVFLTMLYALTTAMLYRFVERLLNLFNYDEAQKVALCTAAFFIVFPYQSEVIVWAAAIHYLIAVILSLGILLLLLKYLASSRNAWQVVGILALFIVAMFATEVIIALPLVICIIGVVAKLNKVTTLSIAKLCYCIVLPCILVIVAFFGLTYQKFGNAVGHYGSDTHLKLDWGIWAAGYIKYVLKFVFLVRYWPLSWASLINWITQPTPAICIVIVFLCVLAIILIKQYKSQKRISAAMLLWLLFSISLLPVLNLHTPFMSTLESDRLGYFASAFYIALLATILMSIKSLFWRRLLVVLMFILFLVASIRNVGVWRFNGKAYYNLLETFPVNVSGTVYVLDVADDYKGAYFLRMGLPEAVFFYYKNKQEHLPHIEVVASSNYFEKDNTVNVTSNNRDSFKVIVNTWGRWFIYLNPATDNSYEVKPNDQYFEYDLRIFNRSPQDKVIYQKGTEWVEIPYKP